jgi:hypothetical protein
VIQASGGGIPIGSVSGSGAGPVSGAIPLSSLPASCRALMHLGGGNPQPSFHAVLSCLTAHGYRDFITYQPANRFWAFQGIEAGIFVFLAAVLIAVTAIVVLRRDA